MNVKNLIHPDDIADTQKKIAEAGELLEKMYSVAGVERPRFITTLDRIKALKEIECDGERVFGDTIIGWLNDNGFFTAPASTVYHGNYIGGLFDHSYQMGLHLQNLTDKLGLEWERPMSPWVVAIFHDLCKIDLYAHDGESFYHRDDPIVKGHGVKSLIYALNVVDLTQEEQACILYHMGAFTDKNEWNNYTEAIHKYSNVLWTHTADMLASHVDLT